MLFVLKKSKLIFCLVTLLIIVCFCGVLKATVLSEQATFLPTLGRTVIIDAGHGAPDGGAVGSTGVLEKDLNLAVAQALQRFFESNGTNVLLTRSDDNGIYDVSGSIKNKKVSDIKNREELINESNADLFISIHMNKFEQSQYRGAQVFYDDDSESNKILAEAIQQSLKDILKDGNNRVAKATGDGIFVIKDNTVPSALIECGFLSNSEEAKALLTPEYQKSVAEGIYTGILKFFSNKQDEKN